MDNNITLRNQQQELFDEILKIINSLDLPPLIKQDMVKEIDKISKTDGITNLIFLGSMNMGKTTSINLILNEILKLKKDFKNNLGCPNLSLNDEQYFRLKTCTSENSYFFMIIESSKNKNFNISVQFSDYEKEFFDKK